MNQTNTTAELKQHNTRAVKTALLSLGAATKAELSQATGLSVVTCGTILNELIATGEITEESQRISSGGRPAIAYQYNHEWGKSLCIYAYSDNEEKHLHFRVQDIGGNIKQNGTFRERLISPEVIIANIRKILRKESDIEIIVIGVQGCVNNGIIEFSDIEELRGTNLAERIEHALKIPTVVENDMNTIALGYSKSNSNEKNVALLFFPKRNTPAGGFIVDGKILRGTSNLAGELSYYPFNFNKSSQTAAFSDIEYAMPIVNQLVTAAVVFLDPAQIVLTGGLASEMNEQVVVQHLRRHLDRLQLPRIIIKPNTESEYFAGLYNLAVEHLLEL
jgi:predicted NBD/HSP70 family sugar kinase